MIELHDVTKNYRSWLPGRRSVQALDGVTLSIAAGEAVGLVGLNGAGKSTLLKILLGYLRPSTGTALIADQDPRRYVQDHGVAYVPERVAIPPGWSVLHAMKTYALLSDLHEDAWDRVDAALDRLDLSALADRPVGTLSKGNLQRLAIAQSLIADRRIMILDEPTDGLDPIWISELRSIVEEWRAADPGRILIMASHNLPEIGRLTNRKLLLHNGRIATELASADPADLEGVFLGRLAELEEART